MDLGHFSATGIPIILKTADKMYDLILSNIYKPSTQREKNLLYVASD